MHTETSIYIDAPLEEIFQLAADIELWPRRLPHYRWVTVLEVDGHRRRVEMAARCGRIPIKWQAVQEVVEKGPRITYRHVKGLTTGMEVEWSFTPSGGGWNVRIVHDLIMRWPLIGRPVAELIVGPHFIHPVASLTLSTIRQLAEAREAAS